MFYQVAVDAQVDRLHTYSHNEHLRRGTRVLVPFGSRQNYGVVLDSIATESFPYYVKDIDRVLEHEPYYSPTLLQMADFISRYYLCPLGRVLALIAPRYLTKGKAEQDAEDIPPRVVGDNVPMLTAAQQHALQAMQQCGNSKPVLLHGVTDSGKTELYLHLIAAWLNDVSTEPLPQFLVMVPEIALTGQMVRVFTQRFPQQVVVAHSALTVRQRWQAYHLLRTGKRAVLIGARSSIFAPFANLKLIVVDEEHDSSYKQGSQLAYHGRDLAVYRGKLEGAQVVLGSATPSLESWHNAVQKKYQLVTLPERIHQHPQQVRVLQTKPPVRQIDLSSVSEGQDAYVLSETTAERIATTLAAGQQVIVIINRRGFSHYLLAKEKGDVVTCINCSVSLTLHDNFQLLKCHYCDYRVPLAKVLEERQRECFQVCGYGSERIENTLKQMFPSASIDRLDSDTTGRKGQLDAVLQRFRQHETDILVGTQMLAKGHDFPNVALLVILHADQMLAMPDFRAAERMFQLLVQAMGRAGRSDNSSEVLVETERPTLPVMEAALAQDYHTFARNELAFREQFRYPPFTRIACLELNSSNVKKLQATTMKIGNLFARSGDLRIRGPADPPLIKINNRYRKVIYFCGRDAQDLHNMLCLWLPQLKPLIPSGIRTIVDVDPQSTL